MTPADLAQVRQIASQAAAAAVANAPGGYLPSIWLGEVQLYNACLAQQGVRTLRGLANIVCNLQSGGSGVGPPCANEREFEFDVNGHLSTVRHGTDLSGAGRVVVRTTTITYDEDGHVNQVLDTWDQEGTLYGRSVTMTYSANGQIATAVCSAPAPYVPPGLGG